MAFFLDPKLNALTLAEQAAPAARAATRTPKPMTNRFPGVCSISGCGKRVPAGKGVAIKRGSKWEVAHSVCP